MNSKGAALEESETVNILGSYLQQCIKRFGAAYLASCTKKDALYFETMSCGYLTHERILYFDVPRSVINLSLQLLSDAVCEL